PSVPQGREITGLTPGERPPQSSGNQRWSKRVPARDVPFSCLAPKSFSPKGLASMSASTRKAAVCTLVTSLSLLLLAGCGPAADELGGADAFSDNGELDSELGLARRAAVFTLSNDAAGNEVLAFKRGEDGR